MEQVFSNDVVIAIIIRGNYSKSGISFFTPSDFSQQLAYMQHPKGKLIQAHIHNEVQRSIHHTKEVLFIRKGKLRVDLYDDQRIYLESKVLEAGDVVLLANGGHGFEVLEDIEMIEVKQGPYAGNNDKVLFSSINTDKLVFK